MTHCIYPLGGLMKVNHQEILSTLQDRSTLLYIFYGVERDGWFYPQRWKKQEQSSIAQLAFMLIKI